MTFTQNQAINNYPGSSAGLTRYFFHHFFQYTLEVILLSSTVRLLVPINHICNVLVIDSCLTEFDVCLGYSVECGALNWWQIDGHI